MKAIQIRRRTPDEVNARFVQQIAALTVAKAELTRERDALQDLLDGKIPQAAAWLMHKVAVQRKALNRRQDRVVAQRLVLRAVNELGHLPSRAEVRNMIDDEETEKRLDAYLKTLR